MSNKGQKSLIGTFTATEGHREVVFVDGSKGHLKWNPLDDERVYEFAEAYVFEEAEDTNIRASMEEVEEVRGSVYLCDDGSYHFVVEYIDAYVDRTQHSHISDGDGLLVVVGSLRE